MRATSTYLLLAILLWVGFAQQAAAQICGLAQRVEPNHRAFVADAQRSPNATSDPKIDNHLSQLIENTGTLSQFYVRDAALRDALATYLSQVLGLRTALRLNGKQAALTVLTTDEYRLSVSMLDAAATRYCAENPDSAVAADQPAASGTRSIAGVSWLVAGPAFLISLLALAGGGYLIARALRLRQDRRVRYNCNVAVTVDGQSGRFAARMIDVSAIGAKLTKTDGHGTDGTLSVTIDGKTYSSKRAWENTHFLGIAFTPPLPLSRVKGWSTSRQNQRVDKAQGANDPEKPTLKNAS